MFNSARLKLTAWYLLIIMCVSISFSIVIYRGLVNEVERFGRVQRLRIQHDMEIYPAPPIVIDIDLVTEAKQRILVGLIMIDGIIFFVSGGLGYFLAGKTLKPIAEMMEEQNRFISDASHELRTPLTSLKTAMEVNLRDKNFSVEEAKTLIKDSIEEVNKLQSLSEELLQLAQYHKPNPSLRMEKISLVNLVRGVLAKMKPMINKKKITINNRVKDIYIEGNKYNLADLLVIILDNAIKYSPQKGTVTLSTWKKQKFLYMSIQDEGVGISEKDLPHVFDRFYRADSARAKKSAGGFGLGLSIAKKIVETYKGTINLKSKVGAGTTVEIGLPIG